MEHIVTKLDSRNKEVSEKARRLEETIVEIEKKLAEKQAELSSKTNDLKAKQHEIDELKVKVVHLEIEIKRRSSRSGVETSNPLSSKYQLVPEQNIFPYDSQMKAEMPQGLLNP